MSAVIKTVNLTKRYGTLVALSNLNLEINEGDCFGFIGPNGAGKTTTIKILATLLQPTWGEGASAISWSAMNPARFVHSSAMSRTISARTRTWSCRSISSSSLPPTTSRARRGKGGQ